MGLLVGRASELEQLESALRRAQSGVGASVLVAGDAGIGKTRLLGELMDRARAAGAQVLSGRGIDLDRRGAAVRAARRGAAAAGRGANTHSATPRSRGCACSRNCSSC